MKKIEKTIQIDGRELTLSTGDLAEQASGAVMATCGGTVVLATVVSSPLREDLGYFPLSVEYRERLSAGGRIKGSRWVKREGRPSDDEILTARLIDRSIRPLFPKNYKKDVQVITTVLSVDMENTPDMIAGVAASAAIAVSPIPWEGPSGMLKVGLKEGKYFINPLDSELELSEMELVVSIAKDHIVMIESGSNEVSEDDIVGGLEYALKEGKKIVDFIEEFAKAAGTKKETVEKEKADSSLEKKIKELTKGQLKDLAKKMATKEAGYADFDEVKNAVKENFEDDEDKKKATKIFEDLFKAEIRKTILSGSRPDGRKHDELRKLSAKVSVLPRTHGSAIFQRGQTQALTVATLGSPSLSQLIETAEGEETKRYIHHYSMPPFSTGETGRVGYPSRREIGHGALAERALMPVIPPENKFPYTIYVATEILSSNGSTSMASVCGSTLSLMDAGVPIKSPVAGIAMGVVIGKDKVAVLTDIVGLEDGNGDMDFKVAGTKDGVTALQLDVKTLSLTSKILKKALAQAKDARMQILDVMNKELDKPRKKVSNYAPKIKTVKIPTDKIGEIIGPGGKNIRKLMGDTDTQIDVDEDGTVNVTGINDEGVKKAIEHIEAVTEEAEIGKIYEGEVKRIQPFGAFVEILPGKDGLVHVSDMSEDYVKDPNDVVSIGDKVQVRVKEIDNLGRINLSMILDPSKDKEKKGGSRQQFGRRDNRRDNRRGGRGERRDNRRNDRRERRGGQSTGPHFPTSRLVDEDKK